MILQNLQYLFFFRQVIFKVQLLGENILFILVTKFQIHILLFNKLRDK